MASSPLASPSDALQRSLSARIQAQRSSSRVSIGSKQDGGSRASDEESKTSVKVGKSTDSDMVIYDHDVRRTSD